MALKFITNMCTVMFYGMSVILFITMAIDKYRAKRKERSKRKIMRVPERMLFLMAVLGGAPGGVLGMIAFNHKTRKIPFRIGFPVLALIWLLIILKLQGSI